MTRTRLLWLVPWIIAVSAMVTVTHAARFPTGLASSGAVPAFSTFPGRAAAQDTTAAPAGRIAYARDGKELRLVAPDGSGDRLLWSHPQATRDLGINGVAWRPDGGEIAFTSGHAASLSLYHSDVYAVRPDGSGLRRLTNPPDPGQFARFPKGTVTVPVRNSQIFITDPKAKTDLFLVYVAGADAPKRILVPVGSRKTVVFKNVADFGKKAQAVVAIHGRYRWFLPGVDVTAGKATVSPELTITGDGIDLLGAFRPIWRSDGSRISFRDGVCRVSSVPARPPVGEFAADPLFSGKPPLGACTWDWGPTPALANQVLYTENASGDSAVYRMTEGGRHPGAKQTAFTDVEYQMLLDLHWLPDGSGFLYTNKNLFEDSANFFRFDFPTRKLTQVTRLEKEFARRFSISPDGKWVVFERAKARDEDSPADLWIMREDGSEMRLLVRNGLSPSWGR
jgi:TolB protein